MIFFIFGKQNMTFEPEKFKLHVNKFFEKYELLKLLSHYGGF